MLGPLFGIGVSNGYSMGLGVHVDMSGQPQDTDPEKRHLDDPGCDHITVPHVHPENMALLSSRSLLDHVSLGISLEGWGV